MSECPAWLWPTHACGLGTTACMRTCCEQLQSTTTTAGAPQLGHHHQALADPLSRRCGATDNPTHTHVPPPPQRQGDQRPGAAAGGWIVSSWAVTSTGVPTCSQTRSSTHLRTCLAAAAAVQSASVSVPSFLATLAQVRPKHARRCGPRPLDKHLPTPYTFSNLQCQLDPQPRRHQPAHARHSRANR